MSAQPDAGRKGPTIAQLKADIDSGRTGEKVALLDPGLSPLGTDDEAAGRSPSPERIAMAREYETRERWVDGKPKNPALNPRYGWAAPAFIGFIVLVGAVFVAVLWLR